ncbi:MAG: hypothetical protein A2Z20_02480 [Bdellovibrionales bacterium RBG_16_40_8]|nr:MAG: hypothetical protein A2Z20_02480 [Bdellovibrionales bacterium RBG_16_40_8]
MLGRNVFFKIQSLSGHLDFSKISNRERAVSVDTEDARLTRVRRGNLGTCRDLRGGVWELKIDLEPGYRIYFGLYGETVVVLLHGGDKGSQTRDIELAHEFWAEYLNDLKST